MFRELVEEFIVLAGLFFCIPYMISFLRGGGTFWFSLLAVLDFIGLLCFSIIHMQGLLKNGRKARSIIFLILVIVVILVSGSYYWELLEPVPA